MQKHKIFKHRMIRIREQAVSRIKNNLLKSGRFWANFEDESNFGRSHSIQTNNGAKFDVDNITVENGKLTFGLWDALTKKCFSIDESELTMESLVNTVEYLEKYGDNILLERYEEDDAHASIL